MHKSHIRSQIARLLPFLTLTALLAAGCRSVTPPNTLATHNPDKWEKDIAAFEASDRTNRPPEGCILFVGSSSIRLWKTLQTDFPGMPAVNRGFGGSQIADSVYYADRIIAPYKPRQIVIYAGTNDINAGKDPELVFGDFVALVNKIRRDLPEARIAFIAVAPNPKRWALTDKFVHFNGLVRGYCERHGMDFVDVFPLMIGANGLPLPDIYVSDQLHMNAKGYAIWKAAVAPILN